MKAKDTIYREKAHRVIESLKKRNMDGLYCETSPQAVEAILRMIPDHSLVGLGGSETILESGLMEALRKRNVHLLDRYRPGVSPEEVDSMRYEGLRSDVYIAGTNAVTVDGKIVNIDGTGNRVAAMIFGPKKVILLAGMNKVVRTVEEAVSRVKNHAAPLNSVRVGKDTPCSRLGYCQDPNCHPPNRICSQLVILESSMTPGRITLVLVGEELGF